MIRPKRILKLKLKKKKKALLIETNLGAFSLEKLKVVVGDGGYGAAAASSTPARAHGVEVLTLSVAALVIRRLVACLFLVLLVIYKIYFNFIQTSLIKT